MGMNEYFNIMVKMLIFFFIFTMVLFPFVFYFSSYKGLDGTKYFWLSKYQIGNIGGATTYCSTSSFANPTSDLILMCESGTLNINGIGSNSGEPVYTAGVIPKSSTLKNYCVNPSSVDSTLTDCSPYVD
jgi:hypothetical protein